MNEQEDRPSRKRHFIIWPLLIAGLIAGFQYFSSQKYVNPETGRAARVALSEGQELALGLDSYREVLSQSAVVPNGPEVETVQKVMKRLEGATGETGAKMAWEVSVVSSPQVNAFVIAQSRNPHSSRAKAPPRNPGGTRQKECPQPGLD